MEWLQNVFGHLFDIFKIYLKFAFFTLVIYFIAEWYILRYDDLETPAEEPKVAQARNGTVDKIFSLMIRFFMG